MSLLLMQTVSSDYTTNQLHTHLMATLRFQASQNNEKLAKILKF